MKLLKKPKEISISGQGKSIKFFVADYPIGDKELKQEIAIRKLMRVIGDCEKRGEFVVEIPLERLPVGFMGVDLQLVKQEIAKDTGIENPVISIKSVDITTRYSI